MVLSADVVRACRQGVASLLPTGRAWSKSEESILGELLYAYAVELATFDERLQAMLSESDPRTALELLDEWERYLGLPSPCTGPLEDLQARRAAIVAKLTRQASASPSFLREFALNLGYVVDIVEFRSFRMGVAGAGDRLSNVQPGYRMGVSGAGDRLENGFGWVFAWAVSSGGGSVSLFRMGSSGAGDRLRQVGNDLLECSFREIAPAHTQVLFFYFYAVDPTPAVLQLKALTT